MKRLFDIFVSLILLVVLSPFMLLIALIILLLDLRSPFFIQERVGLYKNPFLIYKFRTMKDGEVTWHGKIWRRTGVDELPQFFNILKGDMSFVGPRPLLQSDIERLEWDRTYYDQRWELRPGIVGLAQLSPVCNRKMSWFLDRSYIAQQSFGLDMKILASSIFIPIVGKAQIKKWIHSK